jgi:cytochrome c553
MTSPARSSALRTRNRCGARLGALACALLCLPVSAADAEAGKSKAQPCAACHGPGGNSSDPAVPSLAGQTPMYVYYQLLNFRDERRKDPRMSPMAAGMSDADMKDLAEYFSQQKPKAPAAAPPPAQVEAGKAVAQKMHCNSCHKPDFTGQQHIPRLASQHYDYLVKQLRGYKAATRTDLDGMMTESAQPLTEPDIVAVSAYLASLP